MNEQSRTEAAGYPPMPIKAAPYKHQREAFAFVCRLFGLTKGGDDNAGILHSVWEENQEETKPSSKIEK